MRRTWIIAGVFGAALAGLGYLGARQPAPADFTEFLEAAKPLGMYRLTVKQPLPRRDPK